MRDLANFVSSYANAFIERLLLFVIFFRSIGIQVDVMEVKFRLDLQKKMSVQ